MYVFRAIPCVHDPLSFKWDIIDQDGKVYPWGGDLHSALREIKRLEAQANGEKAGEST